MSRVARLKKERKRKLIKTTSCGLALALVLGTAQKFGSFALFTDTARIPSDISLSTGDVDVEINPGKSFENMKPNNEITIPVEITNYGTLNQNIKLDLSISEAIKPYLTEAEYIFNGVSIKDSKNEVENGIMYKDNSLFILAPGACIEGTIKMNIKEMTKDVQNQLSNYNYKINVTVKATQISDDNQVFNKGFCDVVIQENTITIAQREIITVAIGEKAHYINYNGNKYTAVFIPVNVNGIIEANKNDIHIIATVNGNNVLYNAEYVDQGTYKYIKITPKTDSYMIFKDNLNITINIKVGEDDEYSQQCWIKQGNASNSNCTEHNHPQGEDIHRCQIQEVNSEPQNKNWNTLEEAPTIDEIELPVEQSKEESQESRELETIEPPREQDLIILNKEELIESQK